MNTMNIHGVTSINVGEPTVLDVHGGVHTRLVTIKHKGGEFEITAFGAKTAEGVPVTLHVEDDPIFHDYKEACDDLATLVAERDELAGKLDAAYNTVEVLSAQLDRANLEIVRVSEGVADLEMENNRLRQEVDRLHDKVREEASA